MFMSSLWDQVYPDLYHFGWIDSRDMPAGALL